MPGLEQDTGQRKARFRARHRTERQEKGDQLPQHKAEGQRDKKAAPASIAATNMGSVSYMPTWV
jgi:hypothetical protein